MKDSRLILRLGLFTIIISVLVWFYDYKNLDCAEAQTCFTVISGIETQSCTAPCTMAVRPNQICGLTTVQIGNMGGGGDFRQCWVAGTSVSVSGSGSFGICRGSCVNFL